MTGPLTIGDFPEFFGEVHRRLEPGRDRPPVVPFAWQTRLANEVWEKGRWPGTIDIPTGAGKTSVVLIATFLLALDADRSPGERRMPRRIAMVVDRRVIVDQAYLEAQALLEALKRHSNPVLGAVANALRSLWDGPKDAEPMRADMLRGGIVRDESWARRPDRPSILASTVDQVGSRLLFRGYGVSPSMRPIHAGLMGNDTLFFLDEVHLSRPFADTLRRLRDTYQRWGAWETPEALSRWQVSELSATPHRQRASGTAPSNAPFSLQAEDLSPDASPVLYRRLHASKVAGLELVKVSKTDQVKADKTFAKRCAERAIDMLKLPHVTTAAVVVNRVNTARRIYGEIEAVEGGPEVVLVTGRMREVDRARLMKRLNDRLKTGRDRTASTPVVVVATQCIEAGADFDFDGLVTECASLDALRQRMGRLDRDGTLTANGTPAPALVLARSADVESEDGDPVYGPSLRATWEWLNRDRGEEPLDFGWAAWRGQGFSPDEIAQLAAPAPEAPVLLPTHLDLWVQTRPRPVADPDVAMWLHGMKREGTDVQIVWREDVSPELLEAIAARSQSASSNGRGSSRVLMDAADVDGADGREGDFDPLQCLRDLVAFRPPASSETMSIPISAARAWLMESADGASTAADEVADVDGIETSETPSTQRTMRPVAIWRGDDTKVVRSPRELSPGMVLVVPSRYGGLHRASFEDREYGWWDPTSHERVRDVGDGAQLRQRKVAVLRLTADLSATLGTGEVPSPATPEEGEGWSERVTEWVSSVDPTDDDDVSEAIRAMQEAIRTARGRRSPLALVELQSLTVRDGAEVSRRWFGVSCRLPLRSEGEEEDRRFTLDFEPENSSFVGSVGEVRLDDHLHGVEGWAKLMAENCNLPADLVNDLALAGRLHDLGKADPRFQGMMRGGVDRLDSEELLAKSRIAASDRTCRREAQRLSGYPLGTRHELLSLALIGEASSVAEKAEDWDLVCHLVASHHGYCRPFAPYAPDDDPRSVEVKSEPWTFVARTDHGLERLDSGVTDRFWRLIRRYGWFRLAWFEAILRLADHRRSEYEQEQFDQQHGERRGGGEK